MSDNTNIVPFPDESNDYFCNKFIAEASESYINKMLQLGSIEELHDSVPEVDLPEHLCYKLEPLYSNDGSRKYEFLIEYHTRRPNEGIYYGCRGITLGSANHEKTISRFVDEWCDVRAELCTILNNTFPQKDFSHRFKMTDNADNQTYWLFWISLVDDEDIKDVAVRAITIIRNVFQRYLKGERFTSKTMPNKKTHDETAFTNVCFQNLVDKIKFTKSGSDLKTKKVRLLFRRFLDNAEKQQFICRNDFYETAWQSLLSNVDFARMLDALFEYFNDLEVDGFNRMKGVDELSIPWSSMDKVFLNKDGLAFNGSFLKTQLNSFYGDKTGNKKVMWSEKIKEMMAD